MRSKTLDEFTADFLEARKSESFYVDEEGFASLYVRFGERYLPGDAKGAPSPNVFTIANVVVKGRLRGKGLFTKLVDRMLHRGFIVYVECIHNERLRNHLLRNGFQDAARYPGDRPFESLYKRPVRPMNTHSIHP